MNTKIIVLTGGVYSSLGKGITSGSIARILKELGYSISIMKFDPYLNINPAQISPMQHGELFVTEDGCETDLDIGHYERFSGTNMNKFSSVCSGKIYKEIIDNQLENKYGGSTIQVVPHLTDLIIDKIYKNIDNNKSDFLIIEIGGTVGDIESIPFYEAIKRLLYKNGSNNLMFVHCVPVLILSSVYGEIKTKPAQHSIEKLRTYGINPDILVIRSENKIEKDVIDKISKLVLIKDTKIFNSFNLDTTYKLINELYNQKIHEAIFNHFNLKPKNSELSTWNKFIETVNASDKSNKIINILIVGEYTNLHDAYFSVTESVKLTAYFNKIKYKIDFVETKNISEKLPNINDYQIIINGGETQYSKNSKILFDSIIQSNSVCLNYYLAHNNLIDYLNEIENNNLEKKHTKIIGSHISKIIDKDLNSNFGTEFHERYLNSIAISKSSFKSNQFNILSITENDLVDSVIHHNKKFISTSFSPEFSSKPNQINSIYKYIFNKAIK